MDVRMIGEDSEVREIGWTTSIIVTIDKGKGKHKYSLCNGPIIYIVHVKDFSEKERLNPDFLNDSSTKYMKMAMGIRLCHQKQI